MSCALAIGAVIGAIQLLPFLEAVEEFSGVRRNLAGTLAPVHLDASMR